MAACRRLSGASLREVLGEAQGVLFDCDGVLWAAERAVPGAPELLERLSRNGKVALFVSNNSRRSVAELERRFSRLGFRGVRGEQVFSSALCSALYLRQRLLGGEAGAGDSPAFTPGRVFVLGGEGLRGELRDAGLRLAGEDDDDGGEESPGPETLPVRAVVVGYDDQFTFAKLSEACAYLRDPQCLLVATDPDPWHPLSNGQRTPGTGSLTAAVETASGRKAMGVICTSLQVAPGQRIAVKGDVPAGAKSFAFNLGKNVDNLLLHFNARFDLHGDVRTIVCNSKNKGQWGKEHRETNFPFQEGSSAEVFFSHDKKEVTITLPGNHQFKVPNEPALEGIDYVCVEGDFVFKCISLA